MGIDMYGSDLSGTRFTAIDGQITMRTSFFSNVRAVYSDVSGLFLSQIEGWGAGVDGGLNLTGSWSLPGNPIIIVGSQGQGFSLSLRDMDLRGANITDNFFDPLDLRGARVPDDANMQGNTVVKDGVTTRGGLTVFGGTELSAQAVRGNNFGRAVCEPQTSDC